MTPMGRVVILNGAPRSGKSSIADALASTGGDWANLGVDGVMAATPPELQPAMGLRPGGERPDLESVVADQVASLFETVAVQAQAGVDVAVDVGLHDDYSTPLGLWTLVADRLGDLTALVVGVRCPLEEVMRRRDADPDDRYLRSATDGRVPDPVQRWQRAVHDPGIYDLEVDTSVTSPTACAHVITTRLEHGPPPTALAQLAEAGRPPHH
ncbi:MAG: chloramphenicol phosphotransferase [Acidimicrobiia bacterium]|nr:chloramphenicol phosphotransferase [Acidimicrobiia bacterium]